MFQSILLFAVGLVLLIKGADFFVDGASSIAAKLKVPSLIIGLTVVSIGTSLPEAAVSIPQALAEATVFLWEMSSVPICSICL